jgi:trigger factor
VAVVPGAVKTTLTELGDSRVRLAVEVEPQEVEGRLEHRARQLGRQLKLPGFRKGKVPAPLVIQRMGREAILEEALRESLPSWYSEAIASSGVVPVGDPAVDLDFANLPSKGQELQFSIEIGVLPKAELGDYKGLEVGRAEESVEEQRVDEALEGERERLARLDTVERAAATGDFVVIDYLGALRLEDGALEPFAGGEGRDQLVELGSGNLIPGFEEGLVGSAAGEQRAVEVTFPPDYPNGDLAGRAAEFQVTVKEVKEKRLPELSDDFAVDAGFDDLEELRGDVRERLLESERARVQAEYRQAALDAAVANAKVPVTPELVEARAREMWERTLHSLAHRGISREAYLQISGRKEDEILAELQPEAEQALRREAVITAVVAAEGIAPEDEDVLAALAPTAEREGVEPQTLLEDLRSAGRLDDVREDLAAREAIDLIASEAKPIPLARAEAREKLWTPGKEGEGEAAPAGAQDEPGRLWTPDR